MLLNRLVIPLLLIFGFQDIANAQITSPMAVPDLIFWSDANDVNGNGVQPANGSVITSWVDKTGNGNDFGTHTGNVTFESAGFDGINPAIRLASAGMRNTNPFPSNYSNQATVFFVSANVTLTNNFSVNLNASQMYSARYSFHTPWTSNIIFFDGGSCCSTTRLQTPNPNTLTETTIYTGLNDLPGNRQLLRIDGQPRASDATGYNTQVQNGISIGRWGGFNYNGRFGEFIVYDRALNPTEVLSVECYLLNKWKPSHEPAACEAQLSANKTMTMYDSVGVGSYAIPGNDVIYEISVEHVDGQNLDQDSVFLVDSLPPEISFYNGDIDDAGPEVHPVTFTDNSSGLVFDYNSDVGFSNATAAPTNFAGCNYVPVNGYDPNVKYICFNPSGTFQAGTPNPSFSVSFRGQIK